MNVTVGNDIIEVTRIKDLVENSDLKALKRIFTEKEIKYCESTNNMKYQHYAARFAGKEAVFKAISPMLKDKFSIGFNDIEVLNDNMGRPYVNILKTNINNKKMQIDISLSHIKEYAIATVVAKME